ncbi:MAG: SAVED domain-containing protein [Blastocatellia bacterium]
MGGKKTTGRKKGLAQTVRSPVTQVPSRAIDPLKRLLLCVRAGGRCEFDGCNAYLFRHHVTLKEANFSEAAHIVAFKPDGPRGKSGRRPADINDLGNLMLLCPQCHKLIDDHPDEYSRETLEKYKQEHERRIFRLTESKPDQKTTVLVLKSQIAGQTVEISRGHITDAVSPRYPSDPRGWVIDLTRMHGEDEAFFQSAALTIRTELDRFYAAGSDIESTHHLSVFALAPIPILAYFGNRLGNKVATDLYQRHRDTEDWTWKSGGEPIGHKFHRLRAGTERDKVALVLSLSGTIHPETLPAGIDGCFSVYEITLAKGAPAPIYLRLKEDLDDFRRVYLQCLRVLMSEHGKLDEIYLFPAVPAPVAVLCGRELLPKIDPVLLVYDNDRRKGGFNLIMKVNEHE